MTIAKDYTAAGTRIEGSYENDRNADGSQMFKDIIREAFGVTDVIIAHHLVYVVTEKGPDGFSYETVEEIPSADALIFDHKIAQKIWGPNFLTTLIKLAMEPCETRDVLLHTLYYNRGKA